MRNPEVHWHEGMFLRPQHFQAAERNGRETTTLNIDCCVPYAYGIQSIAVAQDSLVNDCFQFGGLRARWKDGTVIAQEHDHVQLVDLAERFDAAGKREETVTVYLALPNFREDKKNVAEQRTGPKGSERYVAFDREVYDEGTGRYPQAIRLRELNYQILFSSEDLSGSEAIPICRLVKSDEQGHYAIDAGYFPPAMTLKAWPPLERICFQIYDLIGNRIKSLTQVVLSQNVNFSSHSQGDLEKLMLLHALNEAYAELSCLLNAEALHPFVAYTALCRIVGRCSVFGPDYSVAKIPNYDHDDLERIFRWALESIRELVQFVKNDLLDQLFFVGAGYGMQVRLKPEWFGADWDWYLAMDFINAGPQEVIALLRDELDWVFGSSDKIQEYFAKKNPGINMSPARHLPSALAGRSNWLFFNIGQEGDAWHRVRETQTLAMQIRREQIVNQSEMQGQKRIMLKLKGKTYTCEFAVFAIQKKL